jgi:hypothetical protein
MFFLAESEISPQVIIVFAAMVFAGIKALLEKMQAAKQPPPIEEETSDYDPYIEYEEVLERQREELGLPTLRRTPAPPPLPVNEVFVPPPRPKVVKPVLTADERQALQNLNIPSNRRKHKGITTKSRLKAHLSSPTAAREALLLSEIFGPPKSMK